MQGASFGFVFNKTRSLMVSAGTRAACINAGSIALADAGIPMRDLVVSCAAGFLNSTPLLGTYASSIP